MSSKDDGSKRTGAGSNERHATHALAGARFEAELRESVVSALAEAIEALCPGKGRAIAERAHDAVKHQKRTPRDAAGTAIHVEIALYFDIGPEDPDAHLFGPGGWRIDCAEDLHIDGHILKPDVVGWRRERVPDWPDNTQTTPDWACEVVEDTTQAHLQSLRNLYARAGVQTLWILDLHAHTISAWERDGTEYRASGTASRPGDRSLPPFEHIRIRPTMIGMKR